MDQPLSSFTSSFTSLDPSHIRLFSKIGIKKASEIWTHAPSDLAKKLKVTEVELQATLDALCTEMAPKPQLVSEFSAKMPFCFTTGDALLDKALGGGVRAGMVTEICGESAAGKTQLALQLALTAQLDRSQGGLDSGVAYFTTSAFLPVRRLAEIAGNHPVLQGCDPQSLTDNVHNCSTTSIPALLSALKVALVQLFKHVEDSKGRLKPVRVLIIDSLGSLFHSLDKTTTTTLVERSKILSEFSYLIHGIAFSKQAAVIVINQVSDVFHSESYSSPVPPPNEDDTSPELIYKDQSIWFNRPPPSAGLYPEREATMGLIWANQVNIRIMVSRTRRRLRSLEDVTNNSSNKRRKGSGVLPTINEPGVSFTVEEQEEAEAGTLIRSLSVVFSSISSPCTLEFVIVKEGIRVTDFRPDNSSKSPPSLAQLPPRPIAPTVSKETTAPSIPQSQGFISARFTQQIDAAAINSAGHTGKAGREGDNGDETKEDFDAFDEEEWASYGMALGDLEEQWDEPELEPGNHSTSNVPSEADENEIEVLESSDAEENFLLDNLLENITQP